jgi:hypothetical protein
MADEFYRKQEIFVRHGKGLRQYPFSFVELVNPSTGVVIGSGMMPDGDSVLQYAPPVSDTDGVPQDMDIVIDPLYLKQNTLASGVLESRFV